MTSPRPELGTSSFSYVRPANRCQVAAFDYGCGHSEQYPTQLCNEHAINRDCARCQGVAIRQYEHFQYWCPTKCGGKSILEQLAELEAEAIRKVEEWYAAEIKQDEQGEKESSTPLSLGLPPKLSPLSPATLSRLLERKRSDDDSDGNVTGTTLEEDGSASEETVETADIPPTSIGDSIDDPDEDVSDLDSDGLTPGAYPQRDPSLWHHRAECEGCLHGTPAHTFTEWYMVRNHLI